ncbi:uncharacterized protein [Dermacentor albipictus]|uniref:uncharacterized protein n=1 Tax=Dermacentor albipictus TaxID=60249 RepID=UPI0031FD9AD4
MQGDGDQVDAVFEDHAAIQAKSLSRTQAGETSEISQELDSPTQSDSERLQRNPYEGGPLRSSFITSSSGNPEHINNVAGVDNRDVHEHSVESNEHGAAPEPFSDAVESPSSPASQVTQPSYEDSNALSADHAAAMAAVHPSSILGALQRVRAHTVHGRETQAAPLEHRMTVHFLRGRRQRTTLGTPLRTRIAGPSLERFVGAHARRTTLGQRNEASVRVRVLPDLEVLEEGPCRLTLMLANDEAGAAEGTHHLAEWETFTRALLTVHVCIHCLTLSISADSRSPRHFYRGFSLRDGTAVIDVEVSAFRDPWIDFVLPYLRSLSRLRMVEQADIGFQDVALLNRDVRGQEMFCELLQMDARLELDVNRNLARILDATRDMPFLRQLVIYLDNAGTEPWEPRQISLNLTQHFCTDVRRLRYEVDATYAHFLRCQCANHRGVSTTTGVETSMIPTLCARRELTGCTGDLVPYIVSVTHPAMLGTYVIHVLCIVCRPVEE